MIQAEKEFEEQLGSLGDDKTVFDRAFDSKRAIEVGDLSEKIRTFALIPTDNPLGIFTQEEWQRLNYHENSSTNQESIAELQQKLSKAKAKKYDGDKVMGYGGFDYVNIKGHYENHEVSYMIFNLTLDDAKAIARAYGQESFFFGIVSSVPSIVPSQIFYYKTTNSCRSYRLIESADTITYVNEIEAFLARFGVQFKINIQEFVDKVSPVKNPVAFENSFTRDTFIGRGSSRRDSRRGPD